MKVINVDLILNTPLLIKYSDNTFVEYTITENPFDSGSYAAHVAFGKNGNKEPDSYIEVYFPRHSNLSHKYSVNGQLFKIRLVEK